MLGEGFHARYGEAHAEREALAACSGPTRAARRSTSRWSPAATTGARRPARTRSSRPASAASSSPPTTRRRRRPGAAWASCATRASRSSVADGEPAAARAAAQPALPQARAHGPPARALQVGDDARRQGRHPHGRLQVDLRRGLAPARAPLARRARRGRRRHRHRARRRPAAQRAHRRRRCASRAAWSSTPRGACRSTPSSSAARPGSRSPSSSSRAASRLQHGRAGGRRAPTSSSPRARTSRPACAPRSTSSAPTGITSILLEGGPRLAGAFLDAGEVDELRLFVAPVVVGGSSARDPLEGEGVERIAQATRALALDVRAHRRRRAGLRPAAGVVSRVHRAGPGPRHDRRGGRDGDGVAAGDRAPRWRARSPRATPWPSTASA